MSRSPPRLADAVYAAAHACEKQSLSFPPDFQHVTWPLTFVSGFKLMATDIEGSDEDYMDNFGRSLFCIAATGAVWGVRLKLALMHGCIPVIVADHVQVQPHLSQI